LQARQGQGLHWFLRNAYYGWQGDDSVVVLGGRDIRGIEYNYPINIHQRARIVLAVLRWIRGQSEIMWARCQAACKVLPGNQSQNLA